MSHFSQGEFDFVERTKHILNHYEQINLKEINDEKYEITLFMNCLMGLVVFPQQIWFDNVPEDSLEKNWYIKNEHIKDISGDKRTLKNFARHIRNSVAHGNFYPLSADKGKTKKITHLRFLDYSDDSKTTITLDAKIPVQTMKKFTLKFADTMLEIMRKS